MTQRTDVGWQQHPGDHGTNEGPGLGHHQGDVTRLSQQIMDLANKLTEVTAERDHLEQTVKIIESSKNKKEDNRWEAQCQRYEERIIELHSVIAELSKKMEDTKDDVIKEESEYESNIDNQSVVTDSFIDEKLRFRDEYEDYTSLAFERDLEFHTRSLRKGQKSSGKNLESVASGVSDDTDKSDESKFSVGYTKQLELQVLELYSIKDQLTQERMEKEELEIKLGQRDKELKVASQQINNLIVERDEYKKQISDFKKIMSSESQLHTVEEGDTEEFDDMMEQLLEGDRVNRNEGTQNMETDDNINDSQLISPHEDSFVGGEGGNDEDSETDSSHSQESSAAEEDEELEENEDEDDGDEEEDDEEDDDGGSDNYGDEQDEYLHDSDDTFLRLGPGADRDVENVIMGGVIDDPFLDDTRNNLPVWGEIGGSDNNTGGDGLAPGGSSGQSSSVAPSHPLLMGRSDQVAGAASSRGQARSLTRQRGFRYIQLNPRSGSGHGNSQILQQLLGPSNGRDIFQFTDSTRVLVMDSGFAILDSDEISGFEGIGQSSGTALSSVPNALVRWNEESRVLDGDSLHDCMTVCKPKILEVVEKHREEEMADKREKKKKMQEEEEAVRKMDEEEKKKKEPEMATTPAPEAAGHSTGSADEMDVVVSENAAVHTAVDSIAAASTHGSIQVNVLVYKKKSLFANISSF